MAQQPNEAPRRGAAIAVAVAGVTLAAGVTLGALVGWVRPPVAPTPTIETTTAATVEQPALPARPTMPEPAQTVDLAAEPVIEAEADPEMVAMERPRRHRDHHERREHGGARERRSHEGDGDDD